VEDRTKSLTIEGHFAPARRTWTFRRPDGGGIAAPMIGVSRPNFAIAVDLNISALRRVRTSRQENIRGLAATLALHEPKVEFIV